MCTLVPIALAKIGKCINLTYHRHAVPYCMCTYETVSMGACSIQSALDMLTHEANRQLFDNVEQWDCV